MDSRQLILLQDLVREAVRTVIKEELPKLLKEELDSFKKSSSKDLKDVKLLVAKQITESRKLGVNSTYPATKEERNLSEGTQRKLGDFFNKMNSFRQSPLSAGIGENVTTPPYTKAAPVNVYQQVLMETAMQPIEEDFEFGAGEDAEGVILNDIMPQQPMTYYGEMDDYQPRNLPSFPR